LRSRKYYVHIIYQAGRTRRGGQVWKAIFLQSIGPIRSWYTLRNYVKFWIYIGKLKARARNVDLPREFFIVFAKNKFRKGQVHVVLKIRILDGEIEKLYYPRDRLLFPLYEQYKILKERVSERIHELGGKRSLDVNTLVERQRERLLEGKNRAFVSIANFSKALFKERSKGRRMFSEVYWGSPSLFY